MSGRSDSTPTRRQYHGSNCPNVTGWNGSYDCLPTLYSEIKRLNSGGVTTFDNGCALSPSASDGSGHPEGQPCASLNGTGAVVASARAADVVVLALGLDIKMTNEEGQDRSHDAAGYALPGKQQELARQLAQTGTPVVAVVLSGMAVGMDFVCAQGGFAVLIGGYGGRFGPTALARILFGLETPTGRLPYSVYPEVWASNTAMADMSLTAGDGRTYKWYRGRAPLRFSLGQGLTYTRFNTTAAITADAGAEEQTVRVSVANAGSVAAQQTVLLFARVASLAEPAAAPQPLPNRQLFDFGRTKTLAPGQSATLTFQVAPPHVSLAGWDGGRIAHKGTYAIEVRTGAEPDGHNSPATVELVYAIRETVTIEEPLPPPPPPQAN